MAKSSILNVISADLAALERGRRLGATAAKVGFDWKTAHQALSKVYEEVGELEEVLESSPDDTTRLRDELGDLLFAVVNVARKLDIDPIEALQHTNEKFVQRFQYIEREVARGGRDIEDMSLEELELLWRAAKQL
jgi:uncharacterized protein YabN with tetrapyrrole methylase and pyrophosphatase domain